LYTIHVTVTGVAEETAQEAISNAVDGLSLPCSGVDLASLAFEPSLDIRGSVGRFTLEKPVNHKVTSTFLSSIETALRSLITVQLYSVKTLKIFVDILVD
jgi:hypothetical protein